MTAPHPEVAPASKQHRFGVLFVHGIGEQLRGETLRAVVDPVVQSLDLWLHGAARCRAEAVGSAAAQEWAAGLPDNVGTPATSARIREQALEMAWSAEWSTAEFSASQKADVMASPFWSGGAALSDGVAAEDGDVPPHSLLHLHTVGERYDVSEGTALLAECWWARSFVPPGPSALTGWTFRVLPLAVGMHFGDIVRRHFALAADAPIGLLRRAWHGTAAIVALIALLLAVPLALPIQALLMAIGLFALVPIGAVRDVALSLQSAIVGALGDSYLLVASPVSRAMIVARCKNNLQWLCDRCDKVLLVAHSQGCAVSCLALTESLPSELREVTWIGSGLRKLEILRAAERDDTTVTAGWLVATMPFVLWSQISAILETGLSEGNVFVTVLAIGAYLFGIIRLVLILRVGATAAWVRLWQALDVRLSEIYATHDPVPHGPLFDQTTAQHGELPAQPVNNRASWVGDHTSYWRNIEEVVSTAGAAHRRHVERTGRPPAGERWRSPRTRQSTAGPPGTGAGPVARQRDAWRRVADLARGRRVRRCQSGPDGMGGGFARPRRGQQGRDRPRSVGVRTDRRLDRAPLLCPHKGVARLGSPRATLSAAAPTAQSLH